MSRISTRAPRVFICEGLLVSYDFQRIINDWPLPKLRGSRIWEQVIIEIIPSDGYANLVQSRLVFHHTEVRRQKILQPF